MSREVDSSQPLRQACGDLEIRLFYPVNARLRFFSQALNFLQGLAFPPEFQPMSKEGKPAEESRREILRASSEFLGHGMALAASAALFGWIGFEVGKRIGAETLLTFLGILFGGAVGFYNLYARLVIRPREEQGHEQGHEEGHKD